MEGVSETKRWVRAVDIYIYIIRYIYMMRRRDKDDIIMSKGKGGSDSAREKE